MFPNSNDNCLRGGVLVIDKRRKTDEWHVGDVLVANSDDSKGLIVKNNNGNYCPKCGRKL